MTTPLQRDIKQPKPFRRPEEAAFLNVMRTASMLVGRLTELLRPYEVTQPQYNVLRILRGAGPDGLPSGEIGERMVSRDPDVTRLLDRMEKRGLLARARDSADRRVITVRLTADGRALVDSLDTPTLDLLTAQLGHLSAEELETLNDLLERARQ